MCLSRTICWQTHLKKRLSVSHVEPLVPKYWSDRKISSIHLPLIPMCPTSNQLSLNIPIMHQNSLCESTILWISARFQNVTRSAVRHWHPIRELTVHRVTHWSTESTDSALSYILEHWVITQIVLRILYEHNDDVYICMYDCISKALHIFTLSGVTSAVLYLLILHPECCFVFFYITLPLSTMISQ